MDGAKLAALLKESQTPDTQKIKAITAELQKNYYAHPQSVLLLIEVTITNADFGVRQQAAVQAARLVDKHWRALPKEQKAAVRQHLVEATMKEQDAKCRHAESRVIAAIANLDLADGEWPDLLPALFNLAVNGEVAQREVASYIIFSILEASPATFENDLQKPFELFSHTIRDAQSADVRINTMMSIGPLLMLIEPDDDEASVKALHSLIPSMVDVFKSCVQEQDEEKTQQAFEVFQQFLAYESQLLGPYLKDLVQLMIDLAANTDADDDVRSQALSFLAQTVHYRRMKVQAIKDMGSQLTLKSMVILTEIDDDEDDEDMTPARSALALLDALANDLPPRQVLVPLLEAFPKFATSQEPGYRKAGILALGNCVEGAPDFVSSQIKPILPHVINLLNDSDAGVRHTALVGLARLAEDIAEDLATEHEALMTALARNLQAAMVETSDPRQIKKNIGIIRSVCGALDSLSEGLDADVMKLYAGELVGNIGILVNHEDFKVKIAAAGALGAIAGSLGEEFKPYFEKTMQALGGYLVVKDSEEELSLRSGVCDALGRIATSVGPEMFQPYVMELMKTSEEGLRLDNSRLRESSFILWSSLAKVYGTEFRPFLDGVFTGLFESLDLEEDEITLQLTEDEKAIIGTDEEIITAGKRIKVRQAGEEDDENAMGDEEDEDWEDAVVPAEAFEKEVAIEVLGDVITNACGGEEVTKYLEKAIEKIAPLAEHSYEGCRKAAICTLWRAYARVWQLMEEQTGTSWEPGFPPKQTPTPALVKLGEIVASATLQMWSEESDRSVVTEVNRNVAATLKASGPAILAQEDMLTQCVTVIGTIITRSHPCQQDLGDDDEEQEVEGTSEYDWLVIDTALDVIIGLAAAMGPAFGELWKVFEKPILKFASSNENIERSTGVGVIAECTANMGASVTQYTSKLLTTLLKRLSDTDMETKSNAAYAVGQLINSSTDSATYLAQFDNILGKLETMLQLQGARIKDNAAGCLSRMIMKHPERVPIPSVLPALVDLLPLEDDYEENAPVYECIYKLYDSNDATVQQLTPKLIPIFEKVLSPPEEQLADETRQLVQQAVRVLYQAQPNLFKGHEGVVRLAGAA
ncbi:ARM repeat-containing protein [Coniochaeta ligniaria NRRL 30616]|uniref:ARM repeat-containing protein n=1 Tax=Coniochaeta ligniaria NRRL 30616 TaxID=1408157 RepID=A0A1J7ICJ9_9PEZI|nr:ARM repeat-containing protein [Coniochaeta ligniaria NRRL 30616]